MHINISEEKLISYIEETLSSSTKSIIVAIDGRCASGKSTLGKKLAVHFDANLFHADDYFLRPEQRTEERLKTPGGNFDIERFTEEIIKGIKSENDFFYTPFDCKSMTLADKASVRKNRLNIIEGSYCCHPQISKSYDIKIFVTTDKKTQTERIKLRNKDVAEMFFLKWIPLEEKYFSFFDIENNSDFIINT